MSRVPIGGPVRPTTFSPLYLHGQHQVDSPRMSGAMDALFTQRILRALRAQVFLHSDLFSGHASEITIT